MNINTTELIEKAKEGDITVVFEKINDGGVRVMHSTLNPALAELSGGYIPEVLEQRYDNDNIALWCIDKQGWRSFRVNTMIEWYTGKPVLRLDSIMITPDE